MSWFEVNLTNLVVLFFCRTQAVFLVYMKINTRIFESTHQLTLSGDKTEVYEIVKRANIE